MLISLCAPSSVEQGPGCTPLTDIMATGPALFTMGMLGGQVVLYPYPGPFSSTDGTFSHLSAPINIPSYLVFPGLPHFPLSFSRPAFWKEPNVFNPTELQMVNQKESSENKLCTLALSVSGGKIQADPVTNHSTRL